MREPLLLASGPCLLVILILADRPQFPVSPNSDKRLEKRQASQRTKYVQASNATDGKYLRPTFHSAASAKAIAGGRRIFSAAPEKEDWMI